MATLTKDQQSIYDLMQSTLSSWGITTLGTDLKNFILKGYTGDTLSLALQQTKAYKVRFSANEARKAANLPELSPAAYIGLEEQYGQVLRAYGIPKGFYDAHDDFTKYIANDVSPAELQLRVQVAHDQYTAAPDYVKSLWSQYFGTKGDMIAAILDPKTATQIIQDRGLQVGIGGAAAAQGLGINQARAQQFQQAGVTLAGARQAYQQIAASMPTDQQIAKRFGTTFGQTAEENDLLLNKGNEGDKRQRLYSEEKGLFESSGSTGADALSVGQSL